MKFFLSENVKNKVCGIYFSQYLTGKVRRYKFHTFLNTFSAISQQSAAMDSSLKLLSTLKIEIIDAHKAGESYKKKENCFEVASSWVHNTSKKWYLTGTVEVKLRYQRQRKLSERTACRLLFRKVNQKSLNLWDRIDSVKYQKSAEEPEHLSKKMSLRHSLIPTIFKLHKRGSINNPKAVQEELPKSYASAPSQK